MKQYCLQASMCIMLISSSTNLIAMEGSLNQVRDSSFQKSIVISVMSKRTTVSFMGVVKGTLNEDDQKHWYPIFSDVINQLIQQNDFTRLTVISECLCEKIPAFQEETATNFKALLQETYRTHEALFSQPGAAKLKIFYQELEKKLTPPTKEVTVTDHRPDLFAALSARRTNMLGKKEKPEVLTATDQAQPKNTNIAFTEEAASLVTSIAANVSAAPKEPALSTSSTSESAETKAVPFSFDEFQSLAKKLALLEARQSLEAPRKEEYEQMQQEALAAASKNIELKVLGELERGRKSDQQKRSHDEIELKKREEESKRQVKQLVKEETTELKKNIDSDLKDKEERIAQNAKAISEIKEWEQQRKLDEVAKAQKAEEERKKTETAIAQAQEGIKDLSERMDCLDGKFTTLNGNVLQLTADVGTLKTDVNGLKTTTTSLDKRMEQLVAALVLGSLVQEDKEAKLIKPNPQTADAKVDSLTHALVDGNIITHNPESQEIKAKRGFVGRLMSSLSKFVGLG